VFAEILYTESLIILTAWKSQYFLICPLSNLTARSSPSWEADSCSGSQITHILLNPKVHYVIGYNWLNEVAMWVLKVLNRKLEWSHNVFLYCNVPVGSISQWNFIALKVQYTTVKHSQQLF
jgi:hypothetical protein